MTLEERLAQCTTCTNRGFDTKIGNICKKTSETPDFEGQCSSYVHDKKTDVLLRKDTVRDRMVMHPSQEVSPVKKFLTNGIFLGILFIVIGIVWIILGLAGDYIYFYPFILIIGGIIVIVQTAISDARNKRNQIIYNNTKKPEDDLLDT